MTLEQTIEAKFREHLELVYAEEYGHARVDAQVNAKVDAASLRKIVAPYLTPDTRLQIVENELMRAMEVVKGLRGGK